MSAARIYLDNAATSFPKPDAVYDAVDRYNRQAGVALGRGTHRLAVEVQRTVDRCRKGIAALLGVDAPQRVLFTFNGTDSLNLALHGLLRSGDHVVTSSVEHNSVLRPLRFLESSRGVEVTIVEADSTGRVAVEDVRAELRPNTRLVAILHASNVTGAVQPIADIGEVARKHGALFLVDAAQSAGHLPLSLSGLPIDLLALPGHKGLLGPLGTGVLALRAGVEDQLQSVRQGGTGSQSEDDHQPSVLPDKYESGNHNTPGLIGLAAAVEWLQQTTVEEIQRREQQQTARLLEGLRRIDNLRVHGPAAGAERVGVVSVSVDGFEPQVLSSILDESFGIQTRAGLHCAPGAHRAIGTLESGGTVRFSTGPFTTDDEIDAAIAALTDIAASV